VLWIDGLERFDQGLRFRLILERGIAWRPDPQNPRAWTHSFNRRLPLAGRLPVVFAPEVLRLGAVWPGGREAWSIDPGPWALEPGERPDGPYLVPLRGRSSPHRWEQEYWAWPLPAAPLELRCEWWAVDIRGARVTVPVRQPAE
jgi:hypothetical protein